MCHMYTHIHVLYVSVGVGKLCMCRQRTVYSVHVLTERVHGEHIPMHEYVHTQCLCVTSPRVTSPCVTSSTCVIVHVRCICISFPLHSHSIPLYISSQAIEEIPTNMQYCRSLAILELSSNPLLRWLLSCCTYIIYTCIYMYRYTQFAIYCCFVCKS